PRSRTGPTRSRRPVAASWPVPRWAVATQKATQTFSEKSRSRGGARIPWLLSATLPAGLPLLPASLSRAAPQGPVGGSPGDRHRILPVRDGEPDGAETTVPGRQNPLGGADAGVGLGERPGRGRRPAARGCAREFDPVDRPGLRIL